jgi:hypothetical protein
MVQHQREKMLPKMMMMEAVLIAVVKKIHQGHYPIELLYLHRHVTIPLGAKNTSVVFMFRLHFLFSFKL